MSRFHRYHNDFHRAEEAVSPGEGYRPDHMNGVFVSWCKRGTIGRAMFGRAAVQTGFIVVHVCRGKRT